MKRPVVGVIATGRVIEGRHAVQGAGERNLRAVADVANAMPIMFAGMPDITDVGELLQLVDGIVLTGGRANVHPTLYGMDPEPRYEPYDERRDQVALDAVRASVDAGLPLLGICRGHQEIAVAFGSTLHPEIRELPGRLNHRMPRLANGEPHPDPAVVFADRHDVALTKGGVFEKLYGKSTIRVNSLHGQGILEAGERVTVEGVAEDGTIEAISIVGAKGFALGVQWHAEFDPQTNPVNRTLLEAFGGAVRAQAARRR
ncbi:MAG: gamma-glutamyl-gamma-aminobutyrate hydrolase family protein [Hyphomicrobiaceae bacterium]